MRETSLTPAQLVLPVFVCEGEGVREAIPSLPGQARHSIDQAVALIAEARALGIVGFALFPKVAPERKSVDGAEGLREGNLVWRAVRAIREAHPEVCVITDVALDPYSSLGHDGVVGDDGTIVNDATNEVLAAMAVLHARAGADIVAPSDMMDGRVGAIRAALDGAGHSDTVILSYAAKYASSFYGPFRDALDSAPPVGAPAHVPRDKKTYQMDPANAREALLEAALDEAEGADILMVKPALAYLDVIARLRERTELPIAAYHVSGEYAMIKAASERGWIDFDAALGESLASVARAGVDIIFTYGAMEWARARQ